MSLTIDSTVLPDAPAAPPGSPPGRLGIWVRVGLAVALVAVSAGVRVWQQSRVDQALRSGFVSPFPLAEVPMDLGPWHGEDDKLDPRIADATGAVDSVFRTYTNAETGVRISMILLYGPSAEVFIHAPEVCYPAAGYATISGPQTRQVTVGDHEVPFYAHTFTRGEGGQRDIQRIFCTWRYAGRWTPARVTYKRFERIPGMFKLHLARAALPGELFTERDPCEDFLALLVPDIERRLAEAEAEAENTAAD